MNKISLVTVTNCFERNIFGFWKCSPENLESLWIIPGTMDDFEQDEQNEKWDHIDDYLFDRGTIVLERKPIDVVRKAGQEVKRKFEKEGFEIILEDTADD